MSYNRLNARGAASADDDDGVNDYDQPRARQTPRRRPADDNDDAQYFETDAFDTLRARTNDDASPDVVDHPHTTPVAMRALHLIMSSGVLVLILGLVGVVFVGTSEVEFFMAAYGVAWGLALVGGLSIVTRVMHLSTERPTLEVFAALLTCLITGMLIVGGVQFTYSAVLCSAMSAEEQAAMAACIAANPGINNVYEHCRTDTQSPGRAFMNVCPALYGGELLVYILCGLWFCLSLPLMVMRVYAEAKRFYVVAMHHRQNDHVIVPPKCAV